MFRFICSLCFFASLIGYSYASDVEEALVVDEGLVHASDERGDNDQPCGLRGSVVERIKDCSLLPGSMKKGFVLVTRTATSKEVYRDIKTGLLWSDLLQSEMSHYKAEKACKEDLKVVVAGTYNVIWRLPSITEYEVAEENGIRQELPNMDYWFWSSSVYHDNSDLAWLFNGSDGISYLYYRYGRFVYVRCVGR